MKFSLSSAQCAAVIKNQHKFKTSGVLFYFVLSKKPLIGFAVNKKLGNAVLRNRFKRRCRSLLFSNKNSFHLRLLVQPVAPLNEIDSLPLCFDKLREFVNSA